MSADAVERLNALCRGEISAVEAYGQALRAPLSARCSTRLRHCQSSHQTRVDLLRMQIGILGGSAPIKSGPWGTFARAAQRLALAAGAKATLAMLEEGEVHGLKRYREQVKELEGTSAVLLNQRLMPLQAETRRIIGDLKHNA